MKNMIQTTKSTSPVSLAQDRMRPVTVEPTYDVGVIVGRFQVPALHDGHMELIEYVQSKHDKVIIVLGCSVLWSTPNNPLDRQARQQMIQAEFPDVHIAYITDHPSDKSWSQQLDTIVSNHTGPAQTAILYGSRDSFIRRYHGRLPTEELEPTVVASGKEARRLVGSAATRPTEDFRAGVVYATQQRYASGYAAVDAVIVDDPYFSEEDGSFAWDRMLLGRKPNESKYRFVGGFFDPDKDDSLRDAAIREGEEETELEFTDDVMYLGSFKVDDWRYRGERDKIISTVFVIRRATGVAHPADDIAEVRWFRYDELTKADVVEEHHPILDMIDSAIN